MPGAATKAAVRTICRPPSCPFLTRSSVPTANKCFRLRLRCAQQLHHTPSRRAISSSSLPRIAQPSIWTSIFPRFLRRAPTHTPSPTPDRGQVPKTPSALSRGLSNPYTVIILLSLVAGSQAIHLLIQRRVRDEWERKTDVRIGKLAEAVRRVQSGEENVDLAALLGTGMAEEEKEWEEVIKELEREDLRWNQSRQTLQQEDGGGGGGGGGGADSRPAGEEAHKGSQAESSPSFSPSGINGAEDGQGSTEKEEVRFY